MPGLYLLTSECNGAKVVSLNAVLSNHRNERTGKTSFASKLSGKQAQGGTIPDLIDLGDDNSIEVIESTETAHDGKRVKFMQSFKGVQIYGGTSTMAVNSNGLPAGNRNTGYLYVDINKDLQSMEPEISDVSAIQRVKDFADCNDDHTNRPVRTESERVIYIHNGNGTKSEVNRAVLCWTVSLLCYNITNNASVSRPNALINANTGEIYEYWNALAEIDIPAVVGKISHVEHHKLNVFQDPAYYPERVCFYKNQMVELMDAVRRPAYSITRFTVRGFPCDAANDEVGFDRTHNSVSPMNDAFLHADITSRMFLELLGRVPHSRHGQSRVIKVKAHADGCSDKAYWDGESVVLGDGCRRFYPMVSLDLVAHEIAHGFTEFTSGLRYRGESGGLNEAFSDITGEAAEFFYRGFNDWKVADGVPKNGRPIRYMDDPTADGVSIDHLSSYRHWGHTVHQSSGLFNKAFYLLSTQPNWDVLKAFKVYATANMVLWSTDETFKCAACKLVIAAEDLGFDISNVKESLSLVGLETCTPCCRMC